MDADGAEETADEMTDAASDSAGQVVWRHRYRQVNMVVDGTSIRVKSSDMPSMSALDRDEAFIDPFLCTVPSPDKYPSKSPTTKHFGAA